MKTIKVSLDKINHIGVNDLANSATLMSAAIFGAVLVFTGVKPHTALEILGFIDDYVAKKAAFNVGGLLQRPAYWTSRTVLRNCILSFAPYVDGIAKGDKAILALSTLPTDEDAIDVAALIIAGGVAENVEGVQGGVTGQMKVDCTAFGKGVNYLLIISEGMPRPAGIVIGAIGSVKIPASTTNNVYVVGTKGRKNTINGLTPGVLYHLSYVIMFGDIVSGFSDESIGSCKN